jgi:hypothetical protein
MLRVVKTKVASFIWPAAAAPIISKRFSYFQVLWQSSYVS